LNFRISKLPQHLQQLQDLSYVSRGWISYNTEAQLPMQCPIHLFLHQMLKAQNASRYGKDAGENTEEYAAKFKAQDVSAHEPDQSHDSEAPLD